MPQFGEVPLQHGEQFALGSALEYLGEEGAAWSEKLGGDGEGVLGECHDAEMVGCGVAGCGGSHVAQHDIGRAAERGCDRCRRQRLADIAGEQGGAGDRSGIGEVDADNGATTADACDGDLGPAARRAAEIDNPLAGA